MNLENLGQDFKAFLKDLQKTSGKEYKFDSKGVELFKYTEELEDFLKVKHDMGGKDLALGFKDLSNLEFVNGQFVDKKDDNGNGDNNDTMSFINILNFFIGNKEIKEKIDLDGDKVVSQTEITNFFKIIKELDKKGEDVTLSDIAQAVEGLTNGKIQIKDLDKEQIIADVKEKLATAQKELEDFLSNNETLKEYKAILDKTKEDYEAIKGKLAEFEKKYEVIKKIRELEEIIRVGKIPNVEEIAKQIFKLYQDLGEKTITGAVDNLKKKAKESGIAFPRVTVGSNNHSDEFSQIENIYMNALNNYNIAKEANDAKEAELRAKVGNYQVQLDEVINGKPIENQTTNVDKVNKEDKIENQQTGKTLKSDEIRAKIKEFNDILRTLMSGSETHLKELNDAIKEARDNYNAIKTAIKNEINAKIDKLEQEIEKIKTDIKAKKHDVDKKQEEYDKNTKELEELEEKIKKQKKLIDEAMEKGKNTDNLERQLDTLLDNQEIIVNIQEKIMSTIENVYLSIEKLQEQSNTLRKDKNNIVLTKNNTINNDPRLKEAKAKWDGATEVRDKYKDAKIKEVRDTINQLNKDLHAQTKLEKQQENKPKQEVQDKVDLEVQNEPIEEVQQEKPTGDQGEDITPPPPKKGRRWFSHNRIDKIY